MTETFSYAMVGVIVVIVIGGAFLTGENWGECNGWCRHQGLVAKTHAPCTCVDPREEAP